MPFAIIPTPPLTTPITALPLTPSAFSPFGTVIQNPHIKPTPSSTVNQGTAQKYPRTSPFTALTTPSRTPTTANINLFVCSPRTLEPNPARNSQCFRVKVLERHPYTTQTFIPLGVNGKDAAVYGGRKYLVIVAPTLPTPSSSSSSSPSSSINNNNSSSTDNTKSNISTTKQTPPEAQSLSSGTVVSAPPTKRQLKKPFPQSTEKQEPKRPFWRPPPFPLRFRRRAANPRPPPFPLPPLDQINTLPTDTAGRGLPDLSKLQAFICNGDQAVTYGVGVWHAPMVALGDRPIDFVVLVNENGSGTGVEGGRGGEDTEEVLIGGEGGGEGGEGGIVVEVERIKARL